MSSSIDVFSDFICPWCYVGGSRLQQARRILEDRHGWRLSLRYRAFELNPDMPIEGLDRKRYRSAKFGSWERSQQLDAATVSASTRDGLEWDYPAIRRTPSTRRAHRLMKLADTHDPELTEVLAARVLRAYFAGGLDIGDPSVLVDIASEAGVPVTIELLDDEDLDRIIDADVDAAGRSGITGVPFTVAAGRSLSGAATVAQYLALLEAALPEQAPTVR